MNKGKVWKWMNGKKYGEPCCLLKRKIAGYENYANRAFKPNYLLITSTVLWRHLVPASLLLQMRFILIAIMNSIEQRILISWAHQEISCPLCTLTAYYHVHTSWKIAPAQSHPLHSTSTHPLYLYTSPIQSPHFQRSESQLCFIAWVILKKLPKPSALCYMT